MIKGVLVALGIMIVSALIPLVHFITVPVSPFIGGYVGINYAQSSPRGYAMKSMQFGSLLGLVVLVVSGAAAVIVSLIIGPAQKVLVLMWIGVAVITLYTGSMSTLGAMYSSLKSQSKSSEASEAE